jgi:ribonucleoside-diphosphate reductase beta chain
MTESTHARAYLRIIAEAFKDSNKLMERIKSNTKMLSRLEFLTENFTTHAEMLRGVQYGNLYQTAPSYCRSVTIKTIVSLLSFEAIMFLGSFANTFALCEATQKVNGVGKLVGLIHDDEAISHKNNGLAFLKIIKDKEKWPEWETTLPEVKGILDRVVEQELDWCDHQFTKCKALVGFNAEILKDYQLYLARDLYVRLGVQYDFKVVDVNPFAGWMNKYTKADMKQVAAQESETSNYLTGASVDDTGEEDFDF